MRMLDGGGNRKSGPGQQTFWTASNRTHIPGIPFKIRARALYITQAAAFKIIERNITRAYEGLLYLAAGVLLLLHLGAVLWREFVHVWTMLVHGGDCHVW